MSKIILNDESREGILKGINKYANTIKLTFGPFGKNIVINDNSLKEPYITKNGFSISRFFNLSNELENVGVKLLKEVTSKIENSVGDGTTMATILAQSIINESIKYIAFGADLKLLREGIDKSIKYILNCIDKISIPIKDDYNKVLDISTIASNGDKEISNIITNTFSEIKQNGIITIQNSEGRDMYVDFSEGMRLENGFISHYFINDKDSNKCILNNTYVLLYDGIISSVRSIIGILNQVKNKPLLIIAQDVKGEALKTLQINNIKKRINVCVVKIPSFGDRKRDLFQDLNIIVNGKIISKENNIKIENVCLSDLGKAKKIIISSNDTIIINDNINKDNLLKRVKLIKNQINECSSIYDKEKFQERLAKLCGKTAIIYVGANSKLELKEKKERVKNCLCSTRASIEGGIIPESESLLVHLSKELEYISKFNDDRDLGVQIIKNAICSPFIQICENGNLNGKYILNNIFNNDDLNYGYDIINNRYENMLSNGIINSTKILKLSLESAVSIAEMLLFTDCVIL